MTNITTGWLKKETHGALKRFEKRWVVVSGNALSYYKKDDNSAVALGTIDLPGKKITQDPDIDHGFKFELTDKDNNYNFCCDTKSEREKWIDAISCISYAPFGGGMFGSSIEAAVKREKIHGGGNIPKILSQCIGYLDNDQRLKENGIFRLPGNERLVKQLKMEFQEGLEPNLETKADTHTVGSLLKLYLRTLADSLIPSILYEDFLAVILTYEFNEAEGVHELKHLFNRIPISNYNALRRLCSFLNKVQSYSSINRMDINNLAIVFSPTILKNNSGDLNLEMSDMQKLKKVVEIMILKHDVLFPQEKEEEAQNAIDLENIDQEELKNLYTVMMIKYQVQSQCFLEKDTEIEELQTKLSAAEKSVQKYTNRIEFLEDYVSRLEVDQRSSRQCPPEFPPAPPPRSADTILTSPQLRRSSPVTSKPPIRPRPRTVVWDSQNRPSTSQ